MILKRIEPISQLLKGSSLYMGLNKFDYNRVSKFVRVLAHTVPYQDVSWQVLYDSSPLAYDTTVTEFSLSYINGVPTLPKHRLVLYKLGSTIPVYCYPYEGGSEETISGDTYAPYPEVCVKQGNRITIEVYADSANGSTAVLNYIELKQEV